MTTADAAAANVPGVAARLAGMIWSPRATLERVVAVPRWLGMLVVTVAASAIGGSLFLATEVGQRALVAQQVRSLESFGVEVTNEQYAQFEQFADVATYVQPLGAAVFTVVLSVIVAGILFVVAYGVLGGRTTFRQVYATVVHAGAVFVVQQLFVQPLNYARGELSNPTTLAAFVPMLDADRLVVRFLGAIDLFFVWWMVLLAMGLSAATGRPTGPIATALLALYALLAAAFALVVTRLAGS